MIVVSKSKYKDLYYVNAKPILKENIDFHKKGNDFSTQELEALQNFINAI